MRIIEKREESLMLEVELKKVYCPYCEKEIDMKGGREECRWCGMVRYEVVKKPINDTYNKSYTYIDGKVIEEGCIDLGEWICFSLNERPKHLNMQVIKDGVGIREFSEFLDLDFDRILDLNKKIEKEPKRHIYIYVGSLTFDQMVKALRLREIRALSRTFNNYLKEKGGK